MGNVILTTVLTMMELSTIWAWETSCKGKKNLSSQTSNMFNVLLIHIQTTSLLPRKTQQNKHQENNNSSPVRRRDQQNNKRRIFQVNNHLEIAAKTKLLGCAVCPREKLFAAASHRAQLPPKPGVRTCLQGMWKRRRERKQPSASQQEGFVLFWLTAWTFGHVQENSREHYLPGNRTAVRAARFTRLPRKTAKARRDTFTFLSSAAKERISCG